MLFLCQNKKMVSQLSCAARAAAAGQASFAPGCEGEQGVAYDGTRARSAGGGESPSPARPGDRAARVGREFGLFSSYRC